MRAGRAALKRTKCSHVPVGRGYKLAIANGFRVSCRPMKYLLLPVMIIVTVCVTALGQAKVELQATDTMRTVLERQVGQVVDLRLESGEKMGGKIEKVTDKLVHLSALTGAEFYDAVVDIEGIAAVTVRTKTK